MNAPSVVNSVATPTENSRYHKGSEFICCQLLASLVCSSASARLYFSFSCVCTSAFGFVCLQHQLSALHVYSSAFASLILICLLFLGINDVYSFDVFLLRRIKSPRLLFYPQEDLSSFLPFRRRHPTLARTTTPPSSPTPRRQ